jgi:CheY-like chemotaxis protein
MTPTAINGDGGLGPDGAANRGPFDVLLIDDHADVRSVLERALLRSGYTVVSCTEGKTALSVLSCMSFRLVITDIHMPGMDGYEVMMKVKESKQNPKVLAISGGTLNMASQSLKMAKLLGCQRVLAKPFDLNTFAAAVKELIGGPSAKAESTPAA